MKTQAFRDLCLSLPGAKEKVTWGHPTFRVANKIFAAHGPDGLWAGIGTDLPEQAELLSKDPATYRVADYTGRFGWVDVRLASADPETVERMVRNAWRRRAPKRLRDAEPRR